MALCALLAACATDKDGKDGTGPGTGDAAKPAAESQTYQPSAESMALEVIRVIMLAAQQAKIAEVKVRVNEDVATFLNNQKRKELADLESEGDLEIKISGSENVYPEHLELDCTDRKGNRINLPV